MQPATGSLIEPVFVAGYKIFQCVFADLPFGVCASSVLAMMDKFIFQGTPEAFHGCVVPTIAFATHGCLHAELGQ